jgi:glycosyltransferase involved in cell wall biosynthesis
LSVFRALVRSLPIETFPVPGAVRTLAFLGNHTPRRCGIATFTADLRGAICEAAPEVRSFVVAMNDAGKSHAYPEAVRFEVEEADITAYRRAADFLNVSDVEVLSLQHEYGIFGGDAGAHLLTLLRGLRMPIVTTLHTILAAPNSQQRAALDEICALSERVVVMSRGGAELLREVHGVPAEKIDLIPHGIPRLPNAAHSRAKLGVADRQVLLTFGLLSPDKGIEHVIDALPAIRERFPNVVYIVLGATHPHVKERQGEAYRLMLEGRGHRLGVDENLIFHDRFVSGGELVQFLAAADIYVTPYLNAEQITSGTLAYAVGSGKTVISTPYRYAQELLAEDRGVLVPWKDSGAIAAETVDLLSDGRRKGEIEQRARAFGHDMEWPVVARAYVQSFGRAVAQHQHRTRGTRLLAKPARRPAALPGVNLGHLRTLTDDTGLLQHAVWTVPRYEDGYCIDDNARALLLLSLVEEARIESAASVRDLATRYLAFVHHAFDQERGRFRNFLSYGRRWTEEIGSEDSHGRALWSLGTVIGRSSDSSRRGVAGELFHAALPATVSFTSPRAWAYALLGIGEYLRSREGDETVQSFGRALATRLLELFRRSDSPGWPWFEDRLTYCNARLPQALMVSGAWMNDGAMTSAGFRTLEWLVETQRTPAGLFAPIGSNGFYVRGGAKAAFDQQPVEACGMVSACLEAHRITGNDLWATRARQTFDWFLGRNQLDQWLYDAGTGGCRDGLHAERANENQGAESTLSFLMSLMEMRLVDRAVASDVAPRNRSRAAHGEEARP